MFSNKLSRMAAAALMAVVAICASAQEFSSEVSLERQSGSDAVFRTTVACNKGGKEAEELAIKSTFNALLHDGVEGLQNGQPMLSEARKDYDYRLYSTKRYTMMLAGKPVKTDEFKYNGMRKITFEVPVNIKSLKNDLEKNDLALNHAWADKKKETTVKAAINPVIVVVPEMNSGDGGFEAMRDLVDANPAYKTGVNKLSELFSTNGYTTRDFRTALENSKTADVLRDGAQTDLRTMVVQQMPGDIVVKIDIDMKQKGATYGANVGVRAVERQTEAVLAAETFTSGFYHVSDPVVIVDKAIETIGPDFFTKLGDAFAQMAKKGRAMNLDFNISATVADWDFDTESPADGSEFKDELEEWLRANSFQGVYDMSLSTDKYIKATINIPLWDNEKNRSYRITNFTAALKRFLKSKLGDEYKVSVTALGQKLSIMIE